MMQQATFLAGPIGPEGISVPGEPERLRRAAEGLDDLSRQLEEIGQQLEQAAEGDDRAGKTVGSLLGVARRTRRSLGHDVDLLRELVEAVRGEADLLTEAQSGVEDLRRRWRQAREELRGVVRPDGGDRQAATGGGGPRPAAIIDQVDQSVARQHTDALERLAGLRFIEQGPGTASAMLVDGDLDQAMTAYRRQVSGVFEDLVESLRRVHRADERLAELLPRPTARLVAVDEAAPGRPEAGAGDQAAEPISRPGAIRSVSAEFERAGQSIDGLADQVRGIRLSIREGRMTPDDERVGSMDGFQRDWTQYFDELSQDLRHARTAADGVAQRLREIDDQGAQQVRRAGRRD